MPISRFNTVVPCHVLQTCREESYESRRGSARHKNLLGNIQCSSTSKWPVTKRSKADTPNKNQEPTEWGEVNQEDEAGSCVVEDVNLHGSACSSLEVHGNLTSLSAACADHETSSCLYPEDTRADQEYLSSLLPQDIREDQENGSSLPANPNQLTRTEALDDLSDQKKMACPQGPDTLVDEEQLACPQGPDALVDEEQLAIPQGPDALFDEEQLTSPQGPDALVDQEQMVYQQQDAILDDKHWGCPQEQNSLTKQGELTCPQEQDPLVDQENLTCPQGQDPLVDQEQVACKQREGASEDRERLGYSCPQKTRVLSETRSEQELGDARAVLQQHVARDSAGDNSAADQTRSSRRQKPLKPNTSCQQTWLNIAYAFVVLCTLTCGGHCVDPQQRCGKDQNLVPLHDGLCDCAPGCRYRGDTFENCRRGFTEHSLCFCEACPPEQLRDNNNECVPPGWDKPVSTSTASLTQDITTKPTLDFHTEPTWNTSGVPGDNKTKSSGFQFKRKESSSI
ncbi:uncharacterized protein LOC112575088 isoform X2 [Pomacea canaliculata]|uniref:uncharacterized protein LOC112575088 isoform X2 n=1 Tax=Pomacea canaliculata TaxID=400727 RepID=UPI000D73206B|nr:uncharacterized protein LOC112575088 isoform X2 [Pomacea canaliculata]